MMNIFETILSHFISSLENSLFIFIAHILNGSIDHVCLLNEPDLKFIGPWFFVLLPLFLFH